MGNNLRGLRKTEPAEPASADAGEGRRATSYDVARLAGVSQSAVSRCFKPGASVSEHMRQRVMEAARELDYQPNAIARGLITRRSNLVAVMISGRVNLYYPEVLLNLTERLAQKDLRVLLYTHDDGADFAALLDQISRYQVDGVISACNLSLSQYEQLARRAGPIVLFNRMFPDHSANAVYCDASLQSRELIDRLVGLGHRRFGLVRGPASNMVSQVRGHIVEQALQAHNLTPACEARGDFTYDSGAAALQALFSPPGPPPTALICLNDMMALGCMDEARNVLGLKVPDEVSIIGFDGIGMARFASYELTTVRQPIGRMSEAAVALLQSRIERPDQSSERRLFEGAIVEGGTIGPPPPLAPPRVSS